MAACFDVIEALKNAGLEASTTNDATQGAIVTIVGHPRPLRLYAWNVTDNGAATGKVRSAHERRIQVIGSKSQHIDMSADAETLILGWANQFTSTPLIVAFNPHAVAARVNGKIREKLVANAQDARASDSQQFHQDLLKKAETDGIAVGTNQHGDHVLAMRPDRFLDYLARYKPLYHRDASADATAASEAEVESKGFDTPAGAALEAEVEGVESTPTSGWGDYPLDAVFVRTETRSVAEVVKRIRAGRYVLDPDFQREFVWPIQKQSKLIESCVMRIPLPVFYVAEAKDGRIIVVDGLQRLTTFTRFLENELRLTGLSSSSGEKAPHPLERLYYKDLALNLQERVQDTQLTMYILDAKAPERARLDIFERVNSGEPLTRQQMRNALYNGPATQWLKRAAASEKFRIATGRALNEKTMRDREAINRFCAFKLLGYEAYTSGDMDDFLGRGLTKLAELPEDDRERLFESFIKSMQLNRNLFQLHAFRKSLVYGGPNMARSVINVSLFEVCSVVLSNDDVVQNKAAHPVVKEAIIELMANEDFKRAITYSTNSTAAVAARFVMLETVVKNALGGARA